MAQDRALSAQIIYDTLTSDTEFMSYVGQYKFVNEAIPIDSISILTPGTKLPQLESQNGLEVVIHDVGQTTRFDYLTESPKIRTTWQVYLLLWPNANGDALTAASKRILEVFSNARSFQTVTGPNDLGALVQVLVSIPEDAAILI